MGDADCAAKYNKITNWLIDTGLQITTMESCTGGVIEALLTDTEGSSAVTKGAYITYSNEAKIMCGVPAETIRKYGVYSLETAAEMARACREAFGAGIGIGVTGSMANADPANPDSVPGQVFYAISISKGAAETIGLRSADEKNNEICFGEVLSGMNCGTRRDTRMAVAERIADTFIDRLINGL